MTKQKRSFQTIQKSALFKLGLCILYVFNLIPFFPYVVDDAYISFVYSKNLVEGNGLTYNGIIVEGFSNPLWTVLIAPFIGIGVDPLLSARILNILAGVISIILLYILVSDFVGGDKPITAFLSCISVTTLSPYLAWTMGGLETVFLSFLITSLVFIEWKDVPRRQLLAPVLLLLIAMIRPEGIIVFFIWLPYRLICRKTPLKGLVLETTGFLIPFLSIFLWRWNTYGFIFPNTAYVKVDPNSTVSLDALLWISSFLTLRPLFSLLLIAGILRFVFKPISDTRVLLPLGISLAFIVFVVFSGRDWMPHHRFLVPIIPLLAFPVSTALTWGYRPVVEKVIVILVVFSIGFETYMILSVYKPLSHEFDLFTGGLIQAGQWIDSNTDESATIAVVDAGALAYYGERRTIDILGLNDPHIAHKEGNSDTDYVLNFKPEIIQLHVGFNQKGDLILPIKANHNLSIIYHPEFIECYKPDSKRPDNPFYPYLFLRVCD